MGAVPGCGVLIPGAPLLEVDSYRGSPRTVVFRRAGGRVLVLGSSQPLETVDLARCAREGVDVVRRRSGGGAVMLEDADPLWVDVWVPRHDDLWHDDVVAAAIWVGEWWRDALAGLGVGELSVHRGRLVTTTGSDLCCFAGRGPGEVLSGSRKLVGVAQWRARTGALFHCAVYERWDPAPLARLLALDEGRQGELRDRWADSATGLREAGAGGTGGTTQAALLDHLPPGARWTVHRERRLPVA